MINSRDSYTNLNTNEKMIIKVSYDIGSTLELKDNINIIAKIC